jgi:histidinol dehydrogenase
MNKIYYYDDKDSMEQFFELNKKRQSNFDDVGKDVINIINSIKENGDTALIEFTNKFDKNELNLNDLLIPQEIIEDSYKNITPELKKSLEFAYKRILNYHKKLKPSDVKYKDNIDTKIDSKWTPIQSVGLYVPGGKALYPSSVLMNAVPAIVAGVDRIVMVTPSINGTINEPILAAAYICGIKEIYRIGGAQAIAALAYGTSLIKKVDMIVGPGNSYVAGAKKQVFGDVGIDMVAGPSEVVVVAEEDMDLDWVIEDLFAQAEHDDNAQSILITKDIKFASKINDEINNRLSNFDNNSTLKKSWNKYGSIIICKSNTDISELINYLAPEHLELCSDYASDLVPQIRNAGAIFIGKFTPEALGDYVVGTNHVLPTLQSARFSSGLSVHNFMKKTSIIECSEVTFNELAESAIIIAEHEGLSSHANSLRARLNKKNRS